MLLALEKNTNNSLRKSKLNLKNQEKNITEIGERKTTENLRKNFTKYSLNQLNPIFHKSIRTEIFKIMDLNMKAIQRKSKLAKQTAEDTTLTIALVGAICFLIAFILLVNLPSNVANPIKELMESIKKIAIKNYSLRVNFVNHNEFGELVTSFNTMAEKLEEYSDSSLAKLMIKKKRIETHINNTHDPVIGLDEKMNIIFVNEEATKTIGLSQNEMIE
jgi:signal transduction histidine kinase